MAGRKHKRIHFGVTQELETRPANIVSEPGQAYRRPADGKLVPLIVIDTAERADFDALLAAYTPETIGDVAIQWGVRHQAPKGTVTLFLQFTAPTKLLLILDFEIVRQAMLVDEIVRTGELYLQGIKRTDRENAEERSSKVRVVVPDTTFAPIWEELLVQELSARSRALGATERQALLIAHESIRKWRIGPH